MIRKASIAGTVTVGLALAALQGSPAFLSSARRFEQCFRGIRDTSRALSPVERLVFGLVLANADPPQRPPAPSAAETPGI
jgi:hypothetical protein